MKKTILALTALAAFCVCGLIAQTVTYTSTQHFWRFQCDAQYNAAGNVTAAPTEAFYHTTITGSDGSIINGPDTTYSWDAIATSGTAVPITLSDGTQATTTRGALLAAIEAVADQVRTTGK